MGVLLVWPAIIVGFKASGNSLLGSLTARGSAEPKILLRLQSKSVFGCKRFS
jgi:hypothetical protein